MVTDNKIPDGYKQTEVGVIPEDWEVRTIKDISTVATGNTPPTHDQSNYGDEYLFVSPADLGTNKYILDTQKKLSVKGFDISRKFPKDSILFTCIGSTIGKLGISPIELTSNQQINAIFPNPGFCGDYLFYILNLLAPAIKSSASEQAVPIINKSSFESIIIPLPPLPEQTAIANVLSDVDSVITSLDKVIAKKKDIKQGAMQELLTGKRRLPGFTGEWKVKRLGDIGSFKGGSGFPVVYQGDVEGDYPFFKVSDMNNDGNSTFMINSNNWISGAVRKRIGANIFPGQTIVFAKIGAAIFLERKKILVQDSCIDNNMMGFESYGDFSDVVFFYYLFLTIQLGLFASTTAVPSINGRDLALIDFAIPPLPEQQAIAQILSDMDKEINQLEQKRDKYKDLKQAMMQQLLTGKIRLV